MVSGGKLPLCRILRYAEEFLTSSRAMKEYLQVLVLVCIIINPFCHFNICVLHLYGLKQVCFLLGFSIQKFYFRLDTGIKISFCFTCAYSLYIVASWAKLVYLYLAHYRHRVVTNGTVTRVNGTYFQGVQVDGRDLRRRVCSDALRMIFFFFFLRSPRLFYGGCQLVSHHQSSLRAHGKFTSKSLCV